MHYNHAYIVGLRVWNEALAVRVTSCLQSYADSGRAATLLSLQVLLSLSPPHQQLVPSQEQLPLLPASFGPAVSKLMMSQLGLRQLLARDASSTGQPLMWHVWWHIGIRRYHWVQQQQQHRQQQQQQQDEDDRPEDSQQQLQQSTAAAAAASSKSSNARMKQRVRKQQQQQQALDAAQQAGLAPLSAGQLAALYADPAARYYAAGFAARQTAGYGTGLRARAALDAPHAAVSFELSQVLQQGRFQVLGHVLSSSCTMTHPADLPQHARQLSEAISRALDSHESQTGVPESTTGAGGAALSALFPPLFRPEGQVGRLVGFWSDEGVAQEAMMVNRSGEAMHIVDCAGVVGEPAAAWALRLELVMQRCDVCGVRLQHAGGRAGDGDCTVSLLAVVGQTQQSLTSCSARHNSAQVICMW